MKLVQVEIHNFRSIQHQTIQPQDLSIFIGKNSSGKSNILKAVAFFLRASASSANPLDRSEFADDSATWVECTFSDLGDAAREELSKYLFRDGTVRFRRTLILDGDAAKTKVNGYLEQADHAWLREGFSEYSDRDFWSGLGIDLVSYLHTPPKSARITRDMHKEFISAYLERHRDEVALSSELSETEAKGRQSALSASLPHLIFVPAVGDIVSEIYGKKASLLNLIVVSAIRKAEGIERYQEAAQKLVDAQGFINPSDHRLPLLADIEREMVNRLSSWDGLTCSIRTDVGSLTDLLASGVKLHIDDGTDSDLPSKGDGIQRQVLFQTFRLYADFRARRGVFKENADEPTDEQASRSSIIIFEEPELFLHPQAQETFYDDLVVVSRSDQVLLATHSNHLLRLEHAPSLHIVRRSSQRDPTIISAAREELLHADEMKRARSIALCTSDITKVFFADRVVVTEGPEDVAYIVGTATEHADCLDRRVAVVAAGGKDSIPLLQRILNCFGIPHIAAYDKDPDKPEHERKNTAISLQVKAARDAGIDARTDEYNPNLPVVCRGLAPTSNKVAEAARFIRDEKPDYEFVTRVMRLFDLTLCLNPNSTNPPPPTAPARTSPSRS